MFDSPCKPPVPHTYLKTPKNIAYQSCLFDGLICKSFPYQKIIKIFWNTGNSPVYHCSERTVILNQSYPKQRILPLFFFGQHPFMGEESCKFLRRNFSPVSVRNNTRFSYHRFREFYDMNLIFIVLQYPAQTVKTTYRIRRIAVPYPDYLAIFQIFLQTQSTVYKGLHRVTV